METLFIGKNAVFLPETESTNSYAINLLKNVNLPDGTVVHTGNQTSGKGQRGGVWKSEPAANLTASIILKPSFLSLQNHFYLYQIAALACYDTIAELVNTSQFDIKIKWPNDILVDNCKIAGVLIENNLVSNVINWSVIGIGLNINQQNFYKLPKATSVKQIINIETRLDKVLNRLCVNFEKYYLLLKNRKYEQLKSDYLTKLFGLNKLMDFEINGKLTKMTVKGINQLGLLVLENESGLIMEADVKDVVWVY
jgi:BirA family transcriptional regulator, biotin operon repressor / biotin---[acetyl-CoA-carboxylase] ligase